MSGKKRSATNNIKIVKNGTTLSGKDLAQSLNTYFLSLFTSKDKIQRLEKKCNKDEASAISTSSPRKTRAQTKQVDWDKCAFCQVHTNERLSSVMAFKTSEQIIKISKFDKILCTRFAGISDWIAAEAKYHLSCFSASKRSRDKRKSEMKDNDLALVWLSKKLEYAADKGHVIRLDDAWERYTILAEKAGNTLPSYFISLRATFKDKLVHMVGDIIEYVQSFERGLSERHILLIPKKCAKMALSQLVAQGTADEEDDELTLPVYHQQDDFLSLNCSCGVDDTS
ncbi:Hypothetical predicted protein [Paramuricea clavata]|uniref:Uncharacterized protein n=1 Tax=Paramuricea clavata TaxID=317549 RepID=A0A6S7HK46_PARCT|nr:Hypothetical predicted protein [Paramuricea clavata]